MFVSENDNFFAFNFMTGNRKMVFRYFVLSLEGGGGAVADIPPFYPPPNKFERL